MHNRQLKLPLWKRVVFVDWNGVLSEDVFWSSIVERVTHPYRGAVSKARTDLFENKRPLLQEWMRGSVSTDHVLEALNVRLDRRCRPDYLHRKLIESCKSMKPNASLMAELRTVSTSSFVVLATDNMDCFLDSLDAIEGLSYSVDGVLCSAALRVLKHEDPELFFGPWLSAHRLAFRDSLLIDDSETNCDQFERAGGSAIRVRNLATAIQELREWHSKQQCAL